MRGSKDFAFHDSLTGAFSTLRQLAYIVDCICQIPSSQAGSCPLTAISINTFKSAKAQQPNLGTHFISVSPLQIRVLSQTNTQQVEKTRSASCLWQHRRRSIPTTTNTNLPASSTGASTFYKGYMTGLIEQMNKMSDASSG
jgi:hypothetical protein